MVITFHGKTLIKSAYISYNGTTIFFEPIMHQRCLKCTKMLVILFSLNDSNIKYEVSKVINRNFEELDQFYTDYYQFEYSSTYTHEDENELLKIKLDIDNAHINNHKFTFQTEEIIMNK